ncbi:ATP-binding cassette domain-containing protein, partial [uncultured Candidatus Puniceispirillum sp.]|uniref:ATP-binding cassette domain-containing protein n=1 Tax=uncultured Candidatus Puniceispirillum sp. TaxID=1985115 RepID=UPI0032B1DFE3
MADLHCKDLCMTFRDLMSGSKIEALKDIEFDLKHGEILTVLGPSGCGKTTLLNMVAGFITPTSGKLDLGGVPIEAPGAERGMVFQQGALFEWLTVSKNVDFGLRMKKTDPEESAALVEKWLDI